MLEYVITWMVLQASWNTYTNDSKLAVFLEQSERVIADYFNALPVPNWRPHDHPIDA